MVEEKVHLHKIRKKILGDDPQTLILIRDAKRVDARGLLCPLPLIKAQEAIKQLHEGDVLVLISDDPAVVLDVQAWCKSQNHMLLGAYKEGERDLYLYIKRGKN